MKPAAGPRTLERRMRADPALAEIGRLIGDVRCWVVGGWLRDRALGIEPPDLDLVVEGDDDAASAAGRLAAAWHRTPRLLGPREKAVWRIPGPAFKVEIWPIRPGGIEVDAQRRDFTCNALFWRLPAGPLVDVTDGLDDLRKRRIRAVSAANLTDDPVRLLRAVRLLGALEGFALHDDTRAWMIQQAPNLAGAPRERIGAELLALARTPGAADALRTAEDLGLRPFMEPVAPEDAGRGPAIDRRALARLTGELPHPVPVSVRLEPAAAILGLLACTWSARSLDRRSVLAWPRALADAVAAAAAGHHAARQVVNDGPAERREAIARFREAFPTVLAVAAARDDGPTTAAWRRWWRQWRRSGARILDPTLPVSAETIVDLTEIDPGPELGRYLAAVRRAVIRGEIRSKNGALRLIEQLAGR